RSYCGGLVARHSRPQQTRDGDGGDYADERDASGTHTGDDHSDGISRRVLLDDERPRHQIVQGLLPVGEACQDVTDAKGHLAEEFAELATDRTAEGDALPLRVSHDQT